MMFVIIIFFFFFKISSSTQSHKTTSDVEKKKLGITDNLIRLSVGLEDVEDIIDDLEQAFKILL